MSLYKPNELCLSFEDIEIMEYLIEPLKLKYPELSRMEFDNGDKEPIGRLSDRIKTIIFFMDRADILKRDFFGVFFNEGEKVAILIYDREFIFIDDTMKKFVGHQETDGYVVYQGTLRNKTHKEILELVKNFIELFLDAEDFRIEEKVISTFDSKIMLYKIADLPEWEAAHPYCCYDVYLKKQKTMPSIRFENIAFYIKDTI